jgi:hypothetical protein
MCSLWARANEYPQTFITSLPPVSVPDSVCHFLTLSKVAQRLRPFQTVESGRSPRCKNYQLKEEVFMSSIRCASKGNLDALEQ